MKLVASPHFPEKRIGYLGMLLLLTENADVLMLATNALKNDLTSDNKFVAGLALCCIGNLATADMSRDLAPEVDKHLSSSGSGGDTYLRKKACLAMARCLAKCPDMVDDFCERIAGLLQESGTGVVLPVVQLMTHVLVIDTHTAQMEGEDVDSTECRTVFTERVPQLVKILRSYNSSNEEAVVQVHILTLLRLLGAHNPDVSDQMNDVLAQVASNTEGNNNNNAVLYECVQTILGTESEDGLRVLAVNILGRFLLHRDNNIRYVALNTLSRCITDSESARTALQRHRQTVVDCLKDPDTSIRQRAVELVYHLVNATNIESLTAELLQYLVVCPREHKGDICGRLLKMVDNYSPSPQWRIDTLITTLTLAPLDANAVAVYISRGDANVQALAAHKLVISLRDATTTHQHDGLLAVGVWCVGEYGDVLLQPFTYTSNGNDDSISYNPWQPMDVVEVLERVTQTHGCPEWVQQRVVTAYAKLCMRYANDASAVEKLQSLIRKSQTSRSLELQSRACQYTTLVHAVQGKMAPKIEKPAPPPSDSEPDLFGGALLMDTAPINNDNGVVSGTVMTAAKEALSRMPVVDIKLLQRRLATDDMLEGSSEVTPRITKPVSSNGGGDLLDIFDSNPAPVANGTTASAPAGGEKSDLDLLSDIFSAQAPATAMAPSSGGYDPFGTSNGLPATAASPVDIFGASPAGVPHPSNNVFGAPSAQGTPAATGDIFGNGPVTTTPVAPSQPRVPALTHAGLQVEFEYSKPDVANPQRTLLIAHFTNTTNSPMNGVNLQVAVPKYITMEMNPPSSTTVPPGSSTVTQKIVVTNSMLGTKNLVLKLKIGFTPSGAGTKVEHMATCSGFPAGKY